MWDLSRSGIQPMSPALAGGFFTTEQSGKPCFALLRPRIFFFFLRPRIYKKIIFKSPLHKQKEGIFSDSLSMYIGCRSFLWPSVIFNFFLVIFFKRKGKSNLSFTVPLQVSRITCDSLNWNQLTYPFTGGMGLSLQWNFASLWSTCLPFHSKPTLGFSDGSAGKESACSMGDLGSIPGLGQSLGEGKGCPL